MNNSELESVAAMAGERLDDAMAYVERLVPGARAMQWAELRALGHRGRHADKVLSRASSRAVDIEYADTPGELREAVVAAATYCFVPRHWRTVRRVASLVDAVLVPLIAED